MLLLDLGAAQMTAEFLIFLLRSKQLHCPGLKALQEPQPGQQPVPSAADFWQRKHQHRVSQHSPTLLTWCSIHLQQLWLKMPNPVCHPNPSSGKYLGTSSSPTAALQGCSPCKELSAQGPTDGFCWFKPHGVNENSSHLLQEHAPDWDYKLVCFAKHL